MRWHSDKAANRRPDDLQYMSAPFLPPAERIEVHYLTGHRQRDPVFQTLPIHRQTAEVVEQLQPIGHFSPAEKLNSQQPAAWGDRIVPMASAIMPDNHGEP